MVWPSIDRWLAFSHVLAWVIASGLWASTACADDDDTLLAVLEEPQCVRTPVLAVRPLFVQTDGRWRTFDAGQDESRIGPAEAWTPIVRGQPAAVLEDGLRKSAGSGRGYLQGLWEWPPDGRGQLSVPNAAAEFAGWCASPGVRPLPLSSRPPRAAREHWRPATKDAKITAEWAAAYRRSYAGTALCLAGPKPQPYQPGIAELQVAIHWVSDAGALVALAPRRPTLECASELGATLGPRWFHISTEGVRDLGAGLSLVEIADFDADGATEALFWSSAYNEDGYVLWSRDFQERAALLWHYH